MRVCPACGAEVAPTVDIGGADHFVLAERPMTLDVVDDGGESVQVVASQDVRIMRCSEVRRLQLEQGTYVRP